MDCSDGAVVPAKPQPADSPATAVEEAGFAAARQPAAADPSDCATADLTATQPQEPEQQQGQQQGQQQVGDPSNASGAAQPAQPAASPLPSLTAAEQLQCQRARVLLETRRLEALAAQQAALEQRDAAADSLPSLEETHQAAAAAAAQAAATAGERAAEAAAAVAKLAAEAADVEEPLEAELAQLERQLAQVKSTLAAKRTEHAAALAAAQQGGEAAAQAAERAREDATGAAAEAQAALESARQQHAAAVMAAQAAAGELKEADRLLLALGSQPKQFLDSLWPALQQQQKPEGPVPGMLRGGGGAGSCGSGGVGSGTAPAFGAGATAAAGTAQQGCSIVKQEEEQQQQQQEEEEAGATGQGMAAAGMKQAPSCKRARSEGGLEGGSGEGSMQEEQPGCGAQQGPGSNASGASSGSQEPSAKRQRGGAAAAGPSNSPATASSLDEGACPSSAKMTAAGTAIAAEADTADANCSGPQQARNSGSEAEREQPAAGGKSQRAAGEEDDLGGDLGGNPGEDLEEYLGWIRSLSRDKLRRELHKRGLSECRTKPLSVQRLEEFIRKHGRDATSPGSKAQAALPTPSPTKATRARAEPRSRGDARASQQFASTAALLGPRGSSASPAGGGKGPAEGQAAAAAAAAASGRSARSSSPGPLAGQWPPLELQFAEGWPHPGHHLRVLMSSLAWRLGAFGPWCGSAASAAARAACRELHSAAGRPFTRESVAKNVLLLLRLEQLWHAQVAGRMGAGTEEGEVGDPSMQVDEKRVPCSSEGLEEGEGERDSEEEGEEGREGRPGSGVPWGPGWLPLAQHWLLSLLWRYTVGGPARRGGGGGGEAAWAAEQAAAMRAAAAQPGGAAALARMAEWERAWQARVARAFLPPGAGAPPPL